MLGKYENIDRRIVQAGIEPVDVLLFTLDSERYLEKCLDSIYREIPVNKIIVMDGGSKDRTLDILKGYPRMEIHVRPDIRTTGKGLEFVLSRAITEWIAFIDSDMELPEGWYDEMSKYKNKYDYFECKRIMHYEFYREVPGSIDINKRSGAIGQLAKLDCFANYHVEDDYMWRATDLLLRQVAEENGYRYGKIDTTYHYHHTTDNPMYESDAEKRGTQLVFEEPKLKILDWENWRRRIDDFGKAIVEYIDPEFIYVRDDEETLKTLMKLDMEWVKKTNIKWYTRLQQYRRKYHTMGRVRRMAGHTIRFLSTIKEASKDYVRNITKC